MDYSDYTRLELRRKFFKLVGAELVVTDPGSGQPVGFVRMKAWKLREDIRLYRDASLQEELLRISARNVIDFGATYDVYNSASDEHLFSLRRKGLRSTFVRDQWLVLDPTGSQIGMVLETSGALALVRRLFAAVNDILGLIFAFVPETYSLTLTSGGTEVQVATIVHRKNPVVVTMGLDWTAAEAPSDHRLGIAAAVLLSIIDANKNA